MTSEHIIPEAIGGRLEIHFLCKPCNDRLGHSVEAAVRTDASIRLAVEQLAAKIPHIATMLRENQKYRAKSLGGTVPGKVKKGKFSVTPHRLPDGSLVLPASDARQAVTRIISNQSADPSILEAALHRFDTAPANSRVRINDNLDVARWAINEVTPELQPGSINDLVLLKIAYEFFACHVGAAIYERNVSFDGIRAALVSSRLPANVEIEYGHAKQYEPFHGLALMEDEERSFVLIRLFGWLAFRVRFKNLAYKGPRFSYMLELDTRAETLSRMV